MKRVREIARTAGSANAVVTPMTPFIFTYSTNTTSIINL